MKRINYLFGDDATPDECWGGKHLSRIMEQASAGYIGVPGLSVWSYRHFAAIVMKRLLKKIAGFFQVGEDDNSEWAQQYAKERGKDVYAWQMGHTRTTNSMIYGLDAAYPSQMQPELLDEYCWISGEWQEWLGFRRKEPILMGVVSEKPVTPKKGRREEADDEQAWDPNVSPETQRLKKMSKDLSRLMEIRREERKLREKYNM